MLGVMLILLSVACGVAEESVEDGYINEENVYEVKTEEPEDYDNYEYEEDVYDEYIYDYVYEDDAVIEIVHEPVIRDLYETLEFLPGFAVYYFDRLQAMWDEDDGEMWGVPLHVPVIIFCEEHNVVAASRPDEEGVLERIYVDGTAIYFGVKVLEKPNHFWSIYRGTWNGEIGAHMTLQLMETPLTFYDENLYPGSIQDAAIISLLTLNHYAMHIHQPHIMGMSGTGLFPGPGRGNIEFSMILEINALVFAIESEDDAEKLAAVRDALSIRNARRYTYNTATDENLWQLSEGMAIYTEINMLFSRNEIVEVIRHWPAYFLRLPNAQEVANFYGYLGGALYGILLDDVGADWRYDLWRGADLGVILQEALGITDLLPLSEIDLERYGYSEIAARVRG